MGSQTTNLVWWLCYSQCPSYYPGQYSRCRFKLLAQSYPAGTKGLSPSEYCGAWPWCCGRTRVAGPYPRIIQKITYSPARVKGNLFKHVYQLKFTRSVI